jgi:hypothetical protein
MRALEQELHFGTGQLPFSIRTAWKPRGSVYSGVSVIHEAMVRGGFNVHPRCIQLIRSLKHHQMIDDHTKHSVDSLRYSLELITKGQLYKPHALKMY